MNAYECLQRPLNDLPGIAASTSQHDLFVLARELTCVAETAARMAEYLDMMAHNQGHDRANREQNRAARRVRKALGYAIPDSRIYIANP